MSAATLKAQGWPKLKRDWTGLLCTPTVDLKSVGGLVIKAGEPCVVTSYYMGAAIRTVEQKRKTVPNYDSMSRVRPGHLELTGGKG